MSLCVVKTNTQLLGDLIGWGYQPLAVAGETKRPVRSDWQSAAVSLDEVLGEGTKSFGLRLGDNGLHALKFDPSCSANPPRVISDAQKALAKGTRFFGKVIAQTMASGGVHIFYRTDSSLYPQLVSLSDQGQPLFSLMGKGEFVEITDHARFSRLEDLPLLSAEDERYLLSIAVAFDQSVLGSQTLTDFDSANSCCAILEANGWRTMAEEDLWFELEPVDQISKAAHLTVSKLTNRAFAWAGSASLPALQSMTPSSLPCYLKHRGDW